MVFSKKIEILFLVNRFLHFISYKIITKFYSFSLKCVVHSVINTEKLTKEESTRLVEKFQPRLSLSEKQFKKWAGKRYLVLIEIKDLEKIEPFKIDRSSFGNMDDLLPVEIIDSIFYDVNNSHVRLKLLIILLMAMLTSLIVCTDMVLQ